MFNIATVNGTLFLAPSIFTRVIVRGDSSIGLNNFGLVNLKVASSRGLIYIYVFLCPGLQVSGRGSVQVMRQRIL